jgi:cell division protein FtsL
MTTRFEVVVSNYLQEVGIMNSHILERVTSEKTIDVMRSVELFLVMAVVVCTVGIVFIAVA